MTELDPITAGVVRALARKVTGLEDRVRSLARGSQARHRSVEGGAQVLYDEADELRAVVGELEDGSYGITTYGGAEMAAPSVPLATPIPGGVTITWDGFDANDEAGWPLDFARVRVHQVTVPGDPPDTENTIGSFESPAGGALTIAHPADVTTYVFFVAVTTAGVESAPSVEVETTGGAVAGGPTAPPAASPTLTTSGSKDAITLVAHGIVDPTTILDYYIDGVLLESTRSTVLVVRSEPDGDPLADDTSYAFHVVARNAVDSADPSPVVPGSLNPAVDTETVIGIVTAGFVLSGAIQVGNITIRPGTGNPGDADYDPGGIVIPLASGGEIRFPADGSPAVIEAILRTADLVVSGGLTINGLTNYINGKLILGAGVADPTKQMTMEPTSIKPYEGLIGSGQVGVHGLALNAAKDRYAVCEYLAGNKTVLKIFDTTGHVTASVTSDAANLYQLSVCAIGADFYVLGHRYNATAAENQWRIHKYDAAGVLQDSTWLSDGTDRLKNVNNWLDGAIGTDGVSLFVGKVQANKRLHVYRYSAALNTTLPTGNYLGPSGYLIDYLSGGMYVGNADFGAQRLVVSGTNSPAGNNGNFAFSIGATTLAHEAADDFAVNVNSERTSGLVWDGTRFQGVVVDSAITIFDYSTLTVDTLAYGQYAWYDNNATSGNKESAPSPVASRLIPKRCWLKYGIPAPPNSGTGADAADAVKVFVDTDATTKLLATILTGKAHTAIAGSLVGSGGPPLGASTFTAASSTGAMESASAKTYLRGDDDAAVPGRDTWHTVGSGGGEPGFLNGWTAPTAGEELQFRKTPTGDVHIRGRVVPGANTTAVFNLPVGYRPTKLARLHLIGNPTNSVTGRANIDPADGSVTIAVNLQTGSAPTAYYLHGSFSTL